MFEIDHINKENLPLVPCEEGQILQNGLVFDHEGRVIGNFDPTADSHDKPRVILWSEFSKVQFSESKWLIENLVPAGGFLILAAPSGEKKSWIALAMANSIATGEPFLGEFKTEKGAVLYLNGEMAKSEVQRRGKLLGLTQTENLWLLNQELDFYNEESSIEWLFETIAEKQIKAVFIDTFRAYAGGMKEEKAEEIRGFLNKFKPLKDMGIALIILDHTRKPTHFEGQTPKKEQLFASQDKVASVELVIMLKSSSGNDDVFIYQVKNRLGKEIEPFQISIQDEVDEFVLTSKVSITYKGEFIAQEHKQQQAEEIILTALHDEGKTSKELLGITKQEKIGDRNAREAIRALLNKGQIEMPAKIGRQNFYKLPSDETEVMSEVII
jgi:hypothetical protein